MSGRAVERETAVTGRQVAGREPVDESAVAPDIDRAARAWRELSTGTPSTAGFQALARVAGNRAASRLLQRQSAAITGQFLRVQIVGHASARWRSARSAKKAAALNLALSEKRAAAVKDFLLGELSGQVPVPIDVDVSVLEDEEGESVTVSGYGEGSREALERTGGDTRSDEQRDRRVDIEAELATTERRSDRVRVQRSTVTRDWLFTITRFTDVAHYYARAELELEIKNPKSGKVARGSARLEGFGKGGYAPDKGGLGPPDMRLRTDRPVGFKNFDGCLIRVYMTNVKLGFGWKGLFIVFGGLRKTPVLVKGKWGLGLKPGGYGVMGELHLHNVPDDFSETEEVGPPYKRRFGRGEALSVMFDTGSAVVKTADADRITEFVAKWARRFQ